MTEKELRDLIIKKQDDLYELQDKLHKMEQEKLSKDGYIGKYVNVNNSNVYDYVTGIVDDCYIIDEIFCSPMDVSILEEEKEKIYETTLEVVERKELETIVNYFNDTFNNIFNK